MAEYLTAGDLARRTGLAYARIVYILESRRIEPAVRIGQLRLYGPDAVEQVQAARRQIEKRRRAEAKHMA